MANTYDLPTEGCENSIVAPDVPCATHNLCVLGIDQRIFRILHELTKNQSSRVTGYTPEDLDRITQMYDELLAFISAAGTRILDTHYLVNWKLTDIMDVAITSENEATNSALQYLIGADITARVCQSTRLNDGLISTDMQDVVDAIEKSRSMISYMAASFNPMDMPQSNPRVPVTIPTGV